MLKSRDSFGMVRAAKDQAAWGIKTPRVSGSINTTRSVLGGGG
jgi:hypothetical protein